MLRLTWNSSSTSGTLRGENLIPAFWRTWRVPFALVLIGLLTRVYPAPGAGAEPRRSQQPVQALSAESESLESFKARLASHLSQPAFNSAQWGLRVLSLDTGKTVFEHKADAYFNPASNTKLFTAALALARLGPEYRIRTSIYATAPPDANGLLKGNVIVYGRGDPTFAARLNQGDYYKSLESLADGLVKAGVRRIEGDLIGDESFFRGPPFGSGWEWDSLQWYYGAEVSSLSVNDNSVDLFVRPAERAGLSCQITTGPPNGLISIINRTRTAAKNEECRLSVYRPVGDNVVYVSGCLAVGANPFNGFVAVHRPASLFIAMLKEVLSRKGISVEGRSYPVDWKHREVAPLDLKRLVELAAVESLPLRDIVRETLKPSQNLYAQLLLLQVGASLREAGKITPRAEQTDEEAGIEALNGFLSEIGIKKGEAVLEEGSGLSRRNLVTPNAIAVLLSYMSKQPAFAVYRDALPIAGVDGTLKTRMTNTPAAGNVRAKTGTLRFVNALSGYATTAGGEHLVFSVMLNNFQSEDSKLSAREAIDTIAVMLAEFTGHT